MNSTRDLINVLLEISVGERPPSSQARPALLGPNANDISQGPIDSSVVYLSTHMLPAASNDSSVIYLGTEALPGQNTADASSVIYLSMHMTPVHDMASASSVNYLSTHTKPAANN